MVALTLAVFPVAQLSQPPSRSGWLADEVILGVSFTSLSEKQNKTHEPQELLEAIVNMVVKITAGKKNKFGASQDMKALLTWVLTEVKEA